MLYFTSLHQCYAILQCQTYYKFSTFPTVKWSCWQVCPDCEKLVLQSLRGRQRFYKCLMKYCNTPLTGIRKSPVQILQGRNARSRKQLGIQFVFWIKKLQDTYKRWCSVQKNPISSEAFYTSEQELSIFYVCVYLNGTIYPYVASETNWVQEVFYSE